MLAGNATRLARIAGTVKEAAAEAAGSTNAGGTLLVGFDQQGQQLGVVQEGMAHSAGLR